MHNVGNSTEVRAAALVAVLSLVFAGSVGAANLVTGDTQPDGYELNVTTLQPQGVQPTEVDLRANVTALDPVYDAALVYWNATNQDTGNEVPLTATLTDKETVTEAVGGGLNASTPYSTQAHVEPLIIRDNKLTRNVLNKTKEYAVSERVNISSIGKGFRANSRNSQRFVDNFRKIYGINRNTVASIAPFIPPPPNISSRQETGSIFPPEGNFGLYFSPDGRKAFLADISEDTVAGVRLNDAYNLSAGITQTGSASVAPLESPAGVHLSPEGKKMFVSEPGGELAGFRLNDAYNLSAGTTQTASASIDGGDGLHFSPDGEKMFTSFGFNGGVQGYRLNEPFNLSAGFTQTDVTGTQLESHGLAFSPNGKKMFVSSDRGGIQSYRLNDAFNLSAGKTSLRTIDVGDAEGIALSPDGTKIFKLDGQRFVGFRVVQ